MTISPNHTFDQITKITVTSSLLMLLMSSTALSQSFSGDFTRVNNSGAAVSTQITALPPADGEKKGFELLTGTATVDAAGGTFTNFATTGAAGSGGGAGLGGVFFVNTGAALTVRDANFTNNAVQGGEGGGGGSTALSDAGFVVTDKRTVGVSNFIADFTGTITGNFGGSFRLTSVTYGANTPPYGVLAGSTIGVQSTGTSQFATVAASTATGLTFGGAGLDIGQYVSSALFTPSRLTPFLSSAFVDNADNVSGNTTRINISGLSQRARFNFSVDAVLVGTGLPPDVKIVSIDTDPETGEPTHIRLSSALAVSTLQTVGLNVFKTPPLTGAAFTTSGNTATFAEGALSPTLEVGMTVTTPGFLPGTRITAINTATNTVTFSNPPPPNLIKFDTSKPGSEIGSTTIFAPTANTGLRVGDVVSGTGIPAGTTVTAVDGDEITLSQAVTAKVPSVVSETLQVAGTTITSRAPVTDVRVGMVVQGDGVPAGTRVTAVDVATNTVTLSNNVTGDPSRLLFVSNLATGGGMNGRAPVLTGVKGTSGNRGVSAFNNAGEGGSGQNGLAGSDNTAGTGGSGGDGGDGRDGSSVNSDLAFEATQAALEIAAAIAQGIGAGVPDPYPKPVLAVAAGLEVAAKVVQAADITRRIIAFQTNVSTGLTGTGGDGGDGGDGGAGSEFFGGGVGGAGGDRGKAAGNVLGDGASGAGGAGGVGGFGGGGGSAGQPGVTGRQAEIAGGGVGGFGGGQGSSVAANGDLSSGVGGSGFGGAIFVRNGGTLILQGSMLFSGNSATGGSSANQDGGRAGAGAGSDLFIMKGATVTIAPDAGDQIIFEGTIADDSTASFTGARNASGLGAGLTINGAGQVQFLGANTYTGDTRIESGRLVAADGEGIHANSRIVFAGPATNGAGGAMQLTGTNVPVLLSAGTFDRWVGGNSDQVLWSGTGGFAALEAGLTVNLGVSALGGQTLTWGRNGFVPDNSSLVLGAVDATGVVSFVNNITTTTPATSDVAFYLIDNAGSTADHSVLKGSVTADVMTVNANAGAATMKVENSLNINTLDLRGGTVETTGNGRLADNAAITIASGATFRAGTADSVGAVTNTGTYDVNAAQTVASLTNNAGGVVDQDANITSAGNVAQNGTLNVTGARRIDVTGATNGLTGTGTINVTAAGDALTIDQQGSTTFGGVIAGAGSVTKEDTGTLTLTGASTFTGGLTVSGGVIDTTGGGTLADAGAITIASGATFRAGTADSVGAVTNTGTYDVNAAQTVASLTNNAGGVVDQDANITSAGNVAQNGTLNVTGARRIDVTGATNGLTGTGTINVTAAGDALTIDQQGSTTFGGVIAGAGSVTKEDTGTLTLTGASTFTGGLTVSGGVIDTTGGGTLADAGAITIASGATFRAGTADSVGAVTNTGTYDVNAAQTVASLTNNAGGVVDQDANITSAGNVAQNGTLNVTGARRIDVTGATNGLTGTGTINVTAAGDALTIDQQGSTTFGGVIAGAGSVTKEDTGTLTLTGASTFTGGLTVSGGVIDTTGGGTLADAGAITIASGATFRAGTADSVGAVTNTGTYDVNAAQTVASLTNNAGGVVDQDANITSAGNVAQNGTLNVTGARRIDVTGATNGLTGTGTINVTAAGDALTIDQQGSTTFGGVIAGAGSVTKEDTGTLTLTGASTFTGGLTVSGGVIDTTGGGTLADAGAITIASGATFRAGTADSVGAVTNTGTYDVNAAQTVASLTNNAGGVVDQDANITSAGNVAQNGTLNVTGARRIDVTGATNGLTGTGTINVTAAGDALTIDQQGSTTFGGVIAGAGSVTKEDTGTLTLTGASTFTGGLTVSGGVIDTTGGGTLADAGAITIASGATFRAGTADSVGAVTNTGTYDVNAAQTVASLTNNAGGVVDQDANITSAGNVAQNGTLNVTGARRIDVTGATNGLTGTGTINVTAAGDALTIDQQGSTTFGGVIAGAGSVTKEGANTLTLTGVNTYTGDTTIAEGELALGLGGNLNAATDLRMTDTKFSMTSGSQVLNSVSGSGEIDLNGANLTLSSASDFTGNITDAGTMQVSGLFDFVGAMSGATFDLDNGSIILGTTAAGVSTAAFANVSLSNSTMRVGQPAAADGTSPLVVTNELSVSDCSVLTVNGDPVADRAAITAGSVSVTGACTVVNGSGFIQANSVTLTGGAQLNPGNSPGVIVFSGDLILENSVTTMELGGTARGTEYDSINVLGRFVIGQNAVLNVTLVNGFVPQTGQTFNLFDFDPATLTGDFASVTNATGLNYSFSPSSGVLVTLGAQDGTQAAQATALAQVLATTGGTVNTDVAAVLDQLINPGSAGTEFVGDLLGGSLLAALSSATPEARPIVFASFTPEGYGGVYEYAYRSLSFGRSIAQQVDLQDNPGVFGNVALSRQNIGSDSSTTLSDYDLSYSAVTFTGGLQTENYGFGFEIGQVTGSANVGSVTQSSGSGQNLTFGAVALINSSDTSSLQAYASIGRANHDLDGSRRAINSTVNFDDAQSSADVYKVGAQYKWTAGNTSFTLDGSLMRGRVGAVTLTEQGGNLNDRLSFTIPSTEVNGGSISLHTRSQINDVFTLTGGIDIDVTRGLNDYVIGARVGNDTSSFDTVVAGIDNVTANITIGGEYTLSPTSILSTSAYINGIGGGSTDGGAEVKLKFNF
jgi:fibronectin-binding autotransporter adhesin